MTGEQTPSLRVARSCVFSPVSPHFRGTTGRQQNSLRLFCFLPVNLVFVAAFAALKVSLWRRMSADATGIFILTGEQTTLLRKKLVRLFSPPLAPTFVAAFAALKVSFPGACPGKDGFITFLRMNPEFTP